MYRACDVYDVLGGLTDDCPDFMYRLPAPQEEQMSFEAESELANLFAHVVQLNPAEAHPSMAKNLVPGRPGFDCLSSFSFSRQNW